MPDDQAPARHRRRAPIRRLAAAAAALALVALTWPAALAAHAAPRAITVPPAPTASQHATPSTATASTATASTATASTITASNAPASTATTAAPATGGVPPGLPASAAYVLVDATTGRILAQSNDHVPMLCASLAKMFTGLVATGDLPQSALIMASARDTALEPDKIGMMPGQGWPLPEVLQSLMVISANDAAYALAEAVAGTPEAFGPVVEQAMRQMGITDDPTFHDPAGLDDQFSIDGGNLIDVRDIAIAARAVLADPKLAPYAALRKLAFTGPQGTVYGLANVNDGFLNVYPGAIGVKTGLTDKSGFSVAEAATRSGRTMLAVVLHGANSYQTASMLLDQGFATPVGVEPAADALPAVHLPGPPPVATPAALAIAGSRPAGHPSSSGPVRQAAVSNPASGGGDSTRVVAPAAAAAVALALVGILTGRRLRRRPRPAHARR